MGTRANSRVHGVRPQGSRHRVPSKGFTGFVHRVPVTGFRPLGFTVVRWQGSCDRLGFTGSRHRIRPRSSRGSFTGSRHKVPSTRSWGRVGGSSLHGSLHLVLARRKRGRRRSTEIHSNPVVGTVEPGRRNWNLVGKLSALSVPRTPCQANLVGGPRELRDGNPRDGNVVREPRDPPAYDLGSRGGSPVRRGRRSLRGRSCGRSRSGRGGKSSLRTLHKYARRFRHAESARTQRLRMSLVADALRSVRRYAASVRVCTSCSDEIAKSRKRANSPG